MSIPRRWQNTLCHNCQWFHAWTIGDDDAEWECSHPNNDYAKNISNPKPYSEECTGFNWKLNEVNNDH